LTKGTGVAKVKSPQVCGACHVQVRFRGDFFRRSHLDVSGTVRGLPDVGHPLAHDLCAHVGSAGVGGCGHRHHRDRRCDRLHQEEHQEGGAAVAFEDFSAAPLSTSRRGRRGRRRLSVSSCQRLEKSPLSLSLDL